MTVPVRDDLPTTKDQAIRHGWYRMGSGAFRVAFTHHDWPGVVLKIESERRPRDMMNYLECWTWEEHCDGPWSHLLTPMLARSACYCAVLMRAESLVYSYGGEGAPWDRDSHASLNKLLWRAVERDDNGPNNMAGAVDDYGNVFAARMLDYAL